MRKRFTNQFKAEVVLELLRGDKTIWQIASERNAAPTCGRLAPDEAGNEQTNQENST